MYDPGKILTWLAENFQSMRASRRKTSAALVGGAMKMQGTGVHSPFCGSPQKADFEDGTKGLKVEAEADAMQTLPDICPACVTPVIIADRGFGNARWRSQIQKWGYLRGICSGASCRLGCVSSG